MKSCRLFCRVLAILIFVGLVHWSKPHSFLILAATMPIAFKPGDRSQDVSGELLYKNPELPVEQRVADLLTRMSLEEKLAMLGGTGFDTKPNARLGIPAIRMADGPQGVRINFPRPRRPRDPSSGTISSGTVNWFSGMSNAVPVPATAFPASVALAATWNPDLVQQVGRNIGQEARILNKDMLLAPCVNIQRTPQGGRNFESYSEDPYLASRMAVAFIKGVQSQGVIASVKHFAANNQEHDRNTVNVKVDERVLYEIYFPAFKAAVQEAGVWAVMSAYNKLNGAWCSENPHLLTDILKNQWGFKGFVLSDWSAVHTTLETANAGLDLEMPRDKFLTVQLLLPLITSGQVKEATIDDKIRRILRAMFSMGLFDRQESDGGAVDTPEQRAMARLSATQGIVLLKNTDALLPLVPRKIQSIALIGPNARVARVGGGGSAAVRPADAVSPLDGIRERAGTRFKLTYAPGCAMEGEDPENEIPKTRADMVNEAVELAAHADVVLLFVGDSAGIESEGHDRLTLELPAGQDDLIEAVAETNKNTVVILNAGAPVLMNRWIDRVSAVVNVWFPGEEGGHAIADILFGDANPSGKLPVTFPKEWKDSPAYGRYPGENGGVDYSEGLYVGYRHFDKSNIEPQFPFGHGLSYTTFGYSDLNVTPKEAVPDQPVQVSFNVSNTGSREGAEVVQLYVRDVHCSLERPEKELKAFRRVVLKPGETQTISFTLDNSAMAFYDPAKHDWVTEPGTFEVLVGASSRDIRLKAAFELTRRVAHLGRVQQLVAPAVADSRAVNKM